MWTWGSNARGEGGAFEEDPRTGEVLPTQPQQRAAPSSVPFFFGGGSVRQVACGQGHCLAVLESGEVFSWGHGDSGQLGVSSKYGHTEPRAVDLVDRASCVACGQAHSLALLVTGHVFAWGKGGFGQLGRAGVAVDQSCPVEVDALHGAKITAVFAGGHSSAAVAEDGTCWCWGWNNNGQLGLGFRSEPLSGVEAPTRLGSRAMERVIDSIDRSTTAQELWQSLIKAIADAAARQTDKTGRALQNFFTRSENTKREEQFKRVKEAVKKGGDDDESGRLIEILSEVLPPFASDSPASSSSSAEEKDAVFVSLCFGERHCAALTAEGELFCWGSNGHGQLGSTAPAGGDVMRPKFCEFFKDKKKKVLSVSCGMAHTACVTDDGTVWTFGLKREGRLGHDVFGTGDCFTPTKVECGLETETALSVSAGEFHTIVVTTNGGVWTWGANNMGQLGYGTEAPADATNPGGATAGKLAAHFPVKLRGLTGVTTAVSGNLHVVVLIAPEAAVSLQLCRDGDARKLEKWLQAGPASAKTLAGARDPESGENALHCAVTSGSHDAAKLVLERCPGLARTGDKTMKLPLHTAAFEGAVKCVTLLVDSLTSPEYINSQDACGRTALHLAASCKYDDIAQVLVSHGARLDLPDSKGKTPIDCMTRDAADRIRRLTGIFDVVISKAPEQHDFAVRLCGELNRQGISVWVEDRSAAVVATEEDRTLQVMRRIADSKALVWVVSHQSVMNSACVNELKEANRRELPLFPIWFDRLENLPASIEQTLFMQQLEDFSKPESFTESAVRLARGIGRHFAEEEQAAAARARKRNRKKAAASEAVDTDFICRASADLLSSIRGRTGRASKEYVFISYNCADWAFAIELGVLLREAEWGFRCQLGRSYSTTCQDSGKKDGREAPAVAPELLTAAEALVIVLTEDAVTDRSVREQIALAENHDMLLFPVVVAPDPAELYSDLDESLSYTLSRAPRFVIPPDLSRPKRQDVVRRLVHAMRLGMSVLEKEKKIDVMEKRKTELAETQGQMTRQLATLEQRFSTCRWKPPTASSPASLAQLRS